MLSKLRLSPQDEILDTSAGTGLLAREILNKNKSFKRLVLNDPASKMLEQARYRLRYDDEIEFHNQLCEQLAFDDNTFSQIICLNSFHYYTHQQEVLRHFRRMLKDGGNLWMLDWNRTGSFKIASKLINWLSPENINCRSLDEMRILLQENGFDIKEEETWSYRWWNFFFVQCEPV